MSEHHVLYKYDACPFCRRVLLFLDDAGINVEMRDTLREPGARRELVEGGGRGTVPCLRIDREGQSHWLYESRDIIEYLRHYYRAA